jgi:hypothetical protein
MSYDDVKFQGLMKVMTVARQELNTLSTASLQKASTELGLNFNQKQYVSRMKALTDPSQYASDRSTAYGDLVTAVDKTYAEALQKYTGAEMPLEMAKRFALQAAANEKAIQQQLFEVNFPSGANVLEQGRSIAIANTRNFPGGMPTRGVGRAPARRRPSARRRRR